MSEGAYKALPEFLLARFDEDEAWFKRVECQCRDLSKRRRDCPTVLLKEVAAKRESVRSVAYYADHIAEIDLLLDALQPLASLYSDHPDYREAWT